ncbi:MAG: CoA transferase [Eubacteriaceae bacterium]|jgi:CoA:oxalate CoA-transferase|nr:CoA transferase [Eubacteriaceae bacterium]
MSTEYSNQDQNITEKPLTGVRILDLTHAYSGPFCTMHLADQGAEVIKIEVPGKGDQSRNWAPFKNGSSGYYAYFNRNKQGLSLDIKSEEGKKIFKSLVSKSDVVVENFRVGTMERRGLGYDVLKEINPGLIYASISGFGLEGDMAARPAYDIVSQAMAGMMSMTGFGNQKTKVGPAIADNYSGTYLALGIAMALYQKSKTGMGRRLDVSMADTIFSILEAGVIEYTINGYVARPEGNRDPGISPFDSYEAKDGQVVIACGTDAFWSSLCDLMEKPELAKDPRFNTNENRCENYLTELQGMVDSWTRQHTVDELEKMIVDAGIPFGKTLTMDQVCEQNFIKERNMLWSIHDNGIDDDILVPGTPIKMHGCEDKPMRSAPKIGEDNSEVLKSILNMTQDEIDSLRSKKII